MTTEVFRFRDPLSFPRIDTSALAAGEEGVWVEPPGTETTRLRIPPHFHDVPSGNSIFPDLSTRPPVVYPPAFALARNNVTLTGYRTTLGADGTFCTDVSFVDEASKVTALNRLASTDDFHNESTGLVRRTDMETFDFEMRDRPVIVHHEAVALLSSTEPSNYGSFLFRALPKLKTLENAGLNLPIVAPLYAKSMMDLLELAGVDASRVIPHYANAVYKFDRAVVLNLRNSQGFLDDATLEFYAQMRAKHGVPSQGRRIYITRRNMERASIAAGTRRMRNEEELIHALTAHGFEIVEPSKLSAVEQIRLFSSAGTVVGPSGSAMFNAVFCHPGTKLIDIESEPHWIHAHMCLFGSLGLDYGIFEASADDRDFSVAHKPFTVDVEMLMRRLLENETRDV
ncbi:glycosyltransferase family 61 protein [Paraburkholderia sp. J94]|uniref:glycosyltransferase family 61 protein n=1 Tax=Paraburkholderia sp. J94 TaxID=2805441 RepID=UPI002AB153F7|nr:glycosyltransferase 61 family protein [Paraburkholderia sp. J94]